MRPPLVVFVLRFFTVVLSVEFINPPPFTATTDFSLNTIYPLGSTLDILWTAAPEDINMSLTLSQLNGTQFLSPFEYLLGTLIQCSCIFY